VETPKSSLKEQPANTDLYRGHLEALQRCTEQALAGAAESGASFGGILFHAGHAHTYHADDQTAPFRTTPHFARFVPLTGPDHLLLFRPGHIPRVVQVTPRDFWYDASNQPRHPYRDLLDVEEAPDIGAGLRLLGPLVDCAYVGNAHPVAEALGLSASAVEPPELMARLDWHRAFKTRYEVACIREAARVAGLGHAAVREGVASRASERELLAAYLAASGQLESETPYPVILAWDDRAAVLHYTGRRDMPPDPGSSLLIDAGASVFGYASDITRTLLGEKPHEIFTEALRRMETMQRELVDAVAPGRDFVELHRHALQGVATIACDLGLLRTKPEAALEAGLAQALLPHGLGHHLGLQVHDVGGQQVAPDGRCRPPPPGLEALRTTRMLEPGQVVTIEPGLYLIPMLLDPLREGVHRDDFDWDLVDALVPHGGIRIEDDVLVTDGGSEDLSRSFVAGGLGPETSRVSG